MRIAEKLITIVVLAGNSEEVQRAVNTRLYALIRALTWNDGEARTQVRVRTLADSSGERRAIEATVRAGVDFKEGDPSIVAEYVCPSHSGPDDWKAPAPAERMPIQKQHQRERLIAGTFDVTPIRGADIFLVFTSRGCDTRLWSILAQTIDAINEGPQDDDGATIHKGLLLVTDEPEDPSPPNMMVQIARAHHMNMGVATPKNTVDAALAIMGFHRGDLPHPSRD